MSRHFWSVAALGLILATATAFAADSEKEVDLKGVKCPVSGAPAKEGTGVAYKGGEVYFCCNNCPKKFEADTEKYATKANFQLAQTKHAKQVKCPISGAKCKPEHSVDVSGVKVYFCCNNCPKAVESLEGDEQVEKVFNDKAFAKAYETKEEAKK